MLNKIKNFFMSDKKKRKELRRIKGDRNKGFKSNYKYLSLTGHCGDNWSPADYNYLEINNFYDAFRDNINEIIVSEYRSGTLLKNKLIIDNDKTTLLKWYDGYSLYIK